MIIFRMLFIALWESLVMVAPREAAATLVTHVSWPEIAEHADFIGVVECITAGGTVATFRVEEAWKGFEEGKEINVTRFGHAEEPPEVTRCGDRLLIAAFKSDPSRLAGISLAGAAPQWWRKLPSLYGTYSSQGRWRLTDVDALQGTFGEDVNSLSDIRIQVQDYLGASADDRERVRILAIVGRMLKMVSELDPKSEQNLSDRRLLEALEKCNRLESLIVKMLNTPRIGSWGEQVFIDSIEAGAAEGTLKILENLRPGQWRWHMDQLTVLKTGIVQNLKPAQEKTTPTPRPDKLVTEDEIQAAKTKLDRGSVWTEAPEAVKLLTVNDPATVADRLVV